MELQGATQPQKWTDLHKTAFEQVKKLVQKTQIIRPINHKSNDPIYLVTDTSDIGIGAWIGQGQPHDIRPARFFSRKFNNAQIDYTTYNKELLAIVAALDHYRPQLVGHKFTILTDHKPLLTFQSQLCLNGKQARWHEIISQFDCKIQHISGIDNDIADALSRVYLNNAKSTENDFISTTIDP